MKNSEWARGSHRRLASDRSGLGILEIIVATGILGVVIAGVMGVMTNINRGTRSSTLISGANILQQNVQNLLSQESLCPLVLKTSGGGTARFNIGQDITEDSTMTNRLHTIQMPSGVVIAQAGRTTQGVLLERIRMRRTNVPALESPGVYRTPFEVQLVFRDDNPAAIRSLGAQEITRLLYVNIVTNGGPNGTHAVARCNGASFSSDQACTATGGTFESGECRYGKLLAAQSIASKTTLGGLIPNGGIATDRLIHTQQNITADQNIIAGGTITSAGGVTSTGVLTQGGSGGALRVDLTTSQLNNNAQSIQGYRGMSAAWDTDLAYFGMIDRGANRKDALIAFGDDGNDELIIAHKGYDRAINNMARFLPYPYPHFSHSDPMIARGGLNNTADYNVAAFEIPGALIFGAGTSTDGSSNPQRLASGYLTVAQDIELGSLKRNISNISFYNRGDWAHMYATAGIVRAWGPITGNPDARPAVEVRHAHDSSDASIVMGEKQFTPPDPARAGAGILLIRESGSNKDPGPVRLRIDGDQLGAPAAGHVLTAMGAGGTVEWRAPSNLSIQHFWFDSNNAPFIDAMNGSDPVRRATVDLGAQWTFCAMSGTYILVERGWHKWAKVEKIGSNWQAFMEIRAGGQHVAYGFYCFR